MSESSSLPVLARAAIETFGPVATAGLVALPPITHILGDSQAMQAVEAVVARVSHDTYPVLILGETGTGKEVVAKLIHEMGSRHLKPFVPVDCASLTPTLIESELFGHTRGAFTGATQVKHGLFELANEGTLFLDEIGELPLELQSKLLRAMQERKIRPVGSTESIPINFRVIAATNRDLEAAIKSNEFRRDLYFRLNVVEIRLPPLRERRADIPLLVDKFLEKLSHSPGPARTISSSALRQLLAYDWPGNVRQLENAIARAAALSPHRMLEAVDFPFHSDNSPVLSLPGNHEIVPLEELERRAILSAIRVSEGDKIAAARKLGIGKTTLYRKLSHYSDDSPAFGLR